MDLREEGRRRGREAAKAKAKDVQRLMDDQFIFARRLWPSLEGVDLPQMLCDYDRERLACEPDYAKFSARV